MTSEPKKPSLLTLAVEDGTPRKALAASLIVGSILVAINQGDVILAGETPAIHKIILTYCVPYMVTTWGAITGKRAAANGR